MKTFKYIAVAMLMTAAFRVTSVFAKDYDAGTVSSSMETPIEEAISAKCTYVCSEHGGWNGSSRWKQGNILVCGCNE
jgi:hypothetical protein